MKKRIAMLYTSNFYDAEDAFAKASRIGPDLLEHPEHGFLTEFILDENAACPCVMIKGKERHAEPFSAAEFWRYALVHIAALEGFRTMPEMIARMSESGIVFILPAETRLTETAGCLQKPEVVHREIVGVSVSGKAYELAKSMKPIAVSNRPATYIRRMLRQFNQEHVRRAA